MPPTVSKRTLAALCGILLFYFTLGLMRARTSQPFCDEGWFASPAVNLLRTGTMSTTVLDVTAAWRNTSLEGLERHTYWTMPLYPVTLSVWFRVAGVGLFQMRMLSVLWGVIALLGWFLVVRVLSGNTLAALAAIGILAVGFQFQTRASMGRMDAMCAALSVGAVAAYLLLRENRLPAAILVSHTLVAAAGLTHPAGIIGLVWVVFLALYYDMPRLKVRHLAVAAVPYLVGAAAWGAYILQEPGLFLKQFAGNAADRGLFFHSPLAALGDEVALRYLDQFGLSARHQGAERLLGVTLLLYCAGWFAIFAIPQARGHRGCRALLIMETLAVAIIGVIDGLRLPHYLIYTIPSITAVWGAAFGTAWSVYPQWRRALVAVAAVLVTIDLMANGARIYSNPLGKSYLPVVQYLREHTTKDRLIMGSGELVFGLGFDQTFIDDFRLGARSGRRPEFIVVDGRYSMWIPRLESKEPDAYRHTQRVLREEFQSVYQNPAYEIYRRRVPLP
jgi:4-amino-4-deoxy-L-arabinose transferase-like glycosyltransferase